MSAAWKNLLAGMADDNADFSGLISNFVDSIVTVSKNLIPRIKTVISGLGELVDGLIKETLPLILSEIPPSGKEFSGWATNTSATAPNVTSPYTPSGDVTLYAVYTEA